MSHSLTDLATLLERAVELIERLEAERSLLEPDEVLSTEGAMALLQIGKTKMLELVHAGELPVVKFGRKWQYSKRDLLEWFRLEGRKNIRTNSDMAIPQSAA